MKKIVLAAFVLFFLSQLYQPSAQALSCVERFSVEDAYEYYDGVIVAQVNEVNNKTDHNEIVVTVKQSFKAIEDRELSFSENITWGSLDGPSEVGKEYLFFLKETDGAWENPLCSATMKIGSADVTEFNSFLKDKEITLKGEPVAISDQVDPTEQIITGDEQQINADQRIIGDDELEVTSKQPSTVWIIVAVAGVLLVAIAVLRFVRRK